MLLIRVGEQAKANLRIGFLIFFVALLAVLPQSMLQGYSEYSLPAALSRTVNPQSYLSFTLAVGVVGIALNPVMLFIITAYQANLTRQNVNAAKKSLKAAENSVSASEKLIDLTDTTLF